MTDSLEVILDRLNSTDLQDAIENLLTDGRIVEVSESQLYSLDYQVFITSPEYRQDYYNKHERGDNTLIGVSGLPYLKWYKVVDAELKNKLISI